MIHSMFGSGIDPGLATDIRNQLADTLRAHRLTESKTGRINCSCGVVCLKGHEDQHVATAIMSVVDERFAMRPQCHYCEKPSRSRDHIVPVFAGGSDAAFNVVPACIKCNGDKGYKITTCSCAKCAESVAWHIDNILLTRPRNVQEAIQQTALRSLIESTIEEQRRKDARKTANRNQVRGGHRGDLPGGGKLNSGDGLLPEEVAETS